MRVTDLAEYYLPSECERRVYLWRHAEVEPALAGPYEQVLRRLGERHELNVLTSLPHALNLAAYPSAQRLVKTREAVLQHQPVLYQPLLSARLDHLTQAPELTGEPDFLIATPQGYIIREVKLARRIDAQQQPYILLQLQLYGWLFERCFGQVPEALEIVTGCGETVGIDYDHGEAGLALLARIINLRQEPREPYTPVGWTKCAGCAFNRHCWPRAEKEKDVAIIAGVDQNLAWALREQGITTVPQLLRRFDEVSLSEVKKPFGRDGRVQRVGKRAEGILRMAQALDQGKEIMLQSPQLPAGKHFVMLDLEGLPPQLDDLQKVYLWGLQVFGDEPGDYQAAMAEFGPEGDQKAWEQFLGLSGGIMEQYGDLPFVHWGSYEKANLNMYISRYGDPLGTGARVVNNLLNLLPITQKSIALPLPSYSLKVVEKYINFKRSMKEYGGDWSMAKYIEAVETEQEAERQQAMAEILAYNREDLHATWAVFTWLQGKGRSNPR